MSENRLDELLRLRKEYHYKVVSIKFAISGFFFGSVAFGCAYALAAPEIFDFPMVGVGIKNLGLLKFILLGGVFGSLFFLGSFLRDADQALETEDKSNNE